MGEYPLDAQKYTPLSTHRCPSALPAPPGHLQDLGSALNQRISLFLLSSNGPGVHFLLSECLLPSFSWFHLLLVPLAALVLEFLKLAAPMTRVAWCFVSAGLRSPAGMTPVSAYRSLDVEVAVAPPAAVVWLG